jgi:hypothetical protein
VLISVVGALAIVAASFFATLWGMDRMWPSCPAGQVTALARPYPKFAARGFAFVKELPALAGGADSNDAPTRSKLLVCENNSLLAPMHSQHADIAKQGSGRYSHWGNALIFSASDNSDPNTNSRSYSVVQPR